MHPTYYSLLARQKIHRKRTGLTVPFLIGALREPGETLPADLDDVLIEISRLLEAIREGTYCVRIARCVNIGQPVAALCDFGYVATGTEAIKSRHSKFALSVEKQYFPKPKEGIASVSQTLCELVGGEILAGNFSYRNGCYDKFDRDDIFFIQAASV